MSKRNKEHENGGGHSIDQNMRLDVLMDYSDYAYDTVTAKDIRRLTCDALVRADAFIEQALLSEELTWDAVVAPTIQMGDELSTLYAPIYITSRTHLKKKVREAARDALVDFERYTNEIWNRSDVYEKFKAYVETDEASALTEEKARYIALQMKQFEMKGHGLDLDSRAQILELSNQLAELGAEYHRNIEDDKTSIVLGDKALAGLSKDFIAGLERTTDGKYRVAIDNDHVFTILQDAHRRSTRKKVNKAYANIAAGTNRPVLEKIVDSRQQVAQLLGHQSWAHYQLEQCMVQTPEDIKEFYGRLVVPLQSLARAEVQAMTGLLRNDGYQDELRVYDTMYYGAKLADMPSEKEMQDVLRYFSQDSVTHGMFEILKELFNLRFEKKDGVPVWHKDVQVYDVYEDDLQVSRLYLDLFARPGKSDGTYHMPIRAGRGLDDGTYRPSIGAVMGEFIPSSEGAPAMLSFGEIHEFVHEMGHFTAMVKAKCQIGDFVTGDDLGLFLGKDYVEMTAQVLEKLAEEPKILRRLSRHYVTGKKLSIKRIERSLEAQKTNRALSKLGRFVLHYSDLLLHDGTHGADLDAVLQESAKIGMLPHEEGTFQLANLTHLINYSAQTSGYDTSEVIAYDIFDSKFKPGGMTSRKVGDEYARVVLQPSGTKDSHEIVRAILGRDFTTKAYLGRLGVKAR